MASCCRIMLQSSRAQQPGLAKRQRMAEWTASIVALLTSVFQGMDQQPA